MSANKENTLARGASRVVSLRVPEELAQKWDDRSVQMGRSPAYMYRALMRRLLSESIDGNVDAPKTGQGRAGQGATGFRQIGEPDGTQTKARIELRLTDDELAAVRSASNAEGSSPQQWVVCAVRAALTNEPQYTLEPARALWAATTEMRAIGRNLNQIARRLNERDDFAIRYVEMNFLRELEKHIKGFAAEISRLQSASINRWRIR